MPQNTLDPAFSAEISFLAERGEAVMVFAALQEAFVRVAAAGDVVMTVTVSNACPVCEDPMRVVDPV